MKFLYAFLIAFIAFQANAFEITSTDIKEGANLTQAQVFDGFGCHGENISPQVSWKNPPKDTKSFAVTMFDPDAPTGSGWWHWTVFNIPATSTSLPRGAGVIGSKNLPTGSTQGRTDFGTPEFGGACPPEGAKSHRYQITVWALKTDKLPLNESSSGAMVGFMLNANMLAKSTLTSLYSR